MVGWAPIGDDRHSAPVCGSDFGQAPLSILGDGLRVAIVAVDGQQHRRLEIHRDARVEAQRIWIDDVGVITAHDDHGVALPGELVIGRNDLAQRPSGSLWTRS